VPPCRSPIAAVDASFRARRTPPGSQKLRALLVCDEVYGFVPPHPANPLTRRPLVSLMKQARAFGNTGLRCVGRLQTDAGENRSQFSRSPFAIFLKFHPSNAANGRNTAAIRRGPRFAPNGSQRERPMNNTDVHRTNGHRIQRLRQHAYGEMRHAVTNAVERGSELAKTLEKRMETRPYLAAGIGLGIASLALGAAALLGWRPRRRRGLAGSIDRFVDDVLEAALRRLKTAI
jgi:hypothetical protein